MQIIIILGFSLETHKRVSREVVLWDPVARVEITSELTKQLLLPRKLPQEWLPAGARTGRSGPVRSWIDRSLVDQERDDAPEVLPGEAEGAAS